jgi:hypothetical protein
MTTQSDGTQKRVLLIGRSRHVIDGAIASLDGFGYAARGTNDFDDVLARFDVREIDLVVFGGAVPAELEAELRERMRTTNPEITFVNGLVGIPGVIVDQVRGAFGDGDGAAHEAAVTPGGQSIRLVLSEAAEVKATARWQTFGSPEPTFHSLVLVDDRLDAGSHAIPIAEDVPADSTFATVEIGPTIDVFAI